MLVSRSDPLTLTYHKNLIDSVSLEVSLRTHFQVLYIFFPVSYYSISIVLFGLLQSLTSEFFLKKLGNGNESNQGNNEPADEFERRIFGGGYGNSSDSGSFFRKLDRLQNAGNMRGGPGGGGGFSLDLEDMGESVNTTLSDGMQGKLREAARHFEYDSEEVDKDDYAFRPDVSFKTGMTYEPKVCKVQCM